jgi:superoxide dismutase, Fe-Mn family
MYEYAYQMDFGAKAANHGDGFMQVLRWNNAERLYVQLANKR